MPIPSPADRGPRRGCSREEHRLSDFLVGQTVTCPHCWETIEVTLDLSAGDQSYIEDCSVCCRPIQLTLSVSDGEIAELTAEAAT